VKLTEPSTIAVILAVAGALVIVSAVFSRASRLVGIPVALIFLAIGVAAGSEGLGVVFDDVRLEFRLGTIALVLILFDGGLNTPYAAVRRSVAPAVVLATLGVAITAAIVALGGRFLGLGWGPAALVGAVVSSTDAAAVFAVLRGSGLRLQRRLGATLELESGLNDPMAVILTFTVTAAIVGGGPVTPNVIGQVVLALAIGAAFGVALGALARVLMQRVHVEAGGLYPVLTVGVAFLAYGLPSVLDGSGFLSVYVAGIVMGAGRLPYRAGIQRVHEALAWLGQVGMFLLLGLLVSPSSFAQVALPGLALGLLVAVVARPIAVWICLAPFRFTLAERVYVSWVGLRGAVPIILATVPILAGVPGSYRIFELVFFMVIVGSIIPGSTVGWLTRKLGLESREPPPPAASLEITSTRLLDGEVLLFYVDEASAVAGSSLADLPFPEGASALLVVRGTTLVAPRGATRLAPGDHLYVFSRPEDRPFLQLLFGRGGEET